MRSSSWPCCGCGCTAREGIPAPGGRGGDPVIRSTGGGGHAPGAGEGGLSGDDPALALTSTLEVNARRWSSRGDRGSIDPDTFSGERLHERSVRIVPLGPSPSPAPSVGPPPLPATSHIPPQSRIAHHGGAASLAERDCAVSSRVSRTAIRRRRCAVLRPLRSHSHSRAGVEALMLKMRLRRFVASLANGDQKAALCGVAVVHGRP
jgi:hypothetical protein